MRRLFVAIDLSEPVKAQLSFMCCGLPGARWTAPEQMHLTLRFIGEVNSSMYRDIREVLGEVVMRPFSMRIEGMGFFPPRGRPRVVWVGIRKNEQIIRLRHRIESVLVHIGLDPEGRKFAPHITLARLHNTPGSKVADFIAGHNLFTSEDVPVDRFFLYSSILGHQGAKHFIEERYSLS